LRRFTPADAAAVTIAAIISSRAIRRDVSGAADSHIDRLIFRLMSFSLRRRLILRIIADVLIDYGFTLFSGHFSLSQLKLDYIAEFSRSY
jgi:hypothetical protein